ncbi:acetyl-CoA C-acetyltransferase [Sporomusa sphaeroides DSM 2875]|uniref:acetyl-CoA C-acetyltransferase n=1 Tax=Sporomusa sphaeroides TaxID=47679 RepID=UPI00202F932B|nr:acetyl-CoA C-acetyltransferase [Sporomusa sphaeroides]MCM0760912.1 acetyl-CoA C-acetyltransferase [Sporomusa sphaeroides DSM 2875]
MQETVIVSAVRTPIGKFGGTLKDLSAADLGGIAIKEAVKRAGVSGEDVDLVIMGQVLQAGCGQIPSRQATFKAGLPKDVPSETLNKVCASSFRAVTLADQVIRAGDAGIVVAGGMESMSNAPYASPNHRWGQRMFHSTLIDLMVHDGLWCAIYDRHMAVHGGVVAKEYDISREEQDEWALRSQQLASQAIASGVLKEEIVPVVIRSKKGEVVFDTDESPRPDTTLQALAKLPALFDKDNTVTAGNAPGTNDAGSAIVLMAREKAEAMNVKPLATIIGHAMVAEDAAYIASAPGNAINKLLKKVNMSIADIDLIEINEAFAAVALVSGKIIGCDPKKVNVNGGAIAFGHPIGSSGARVIMTLVYEMRRRGLKYGIAAICSGAAQGDAILVRCDY